MFRQVQAGVETEGSENREDPGTTQAASTHTELKEQAF